MRGSPAGSLRRRLAVAVASGVEEYSGSGMRMHALLLRGWTVSALVTISSPACRVLRFLM